MGRTVCPINVPCGLHIIGTERHEARRIDNQLRGRCGRQGDPGSSRFSLSLQDDLLKLFMPDWMLKMMEKLGFSARVHQPGGQAPDQGHRTGPAQGGGAQLLDTKTPSGVGRADGLPAEGVLLRPAANPRGARPCPVDLRHHRQLRIERHTSRSVPQRPDYNKTVHRRVVSGRNLDLTMDEDRIRRRRYRRGRRRAFAARPRTRPTIRFARPSASTSIRKSRPGSGTSAGSLALGANGRSTISVTRRINSARWNPARSRTPCSRPPHALRRASTSTGSPSTSTPSIPIGRLGRMGAAASSTSTSTRQEVLDVQSARTNSAEALA